MTIQPSSDLVVRNVGLSGIAITPNRLREPKQETIDSLVESIKSVGLINPITLQPRGEIGYYLIAGRSRLEAARKLKWESIPAIILSGLDALDAELVEIDENLIRADLSPAEQSLHVSRRKDIYEKQHPETKHGGDRKSKNAKSSPQNEDSFTKDTAKKTGKSRQSVERDAKRGKRVKVLTDIVGTSLDKGDELDALAKLSEEDQRKLADRAAAGEKVSAKAAVKQRGRAERERELATKQAALPDKRYGVIYADPEWRFEVYSRETGMDRSADNHYPTSSVEEICSRPVSDIAADDCVLFLWATVPMLPDALRVMDAWDFQYKSHCIWAKDRIGTGYWFRNQHEILLVGTRGNVPAPAMGTQIASLVDAPVGRHSEKPVEFYELIERYFPNLPKIELNARAARPGWDAWGYEAPSGVEAA